ncbi:histidine phosphatase family protein [Antarcticibacterium arcticum]|uniref:Histidine phosphatase family protein n=1 Tax=Antarcticibacterium arcticum TaxID=2585771 RepID=A0A5B8YIR1_9FLAO|nr:phosphoglycerate mutase family protein [Antarcticibacterium arcticum]QED37521.1 histidine phosphatase family protein [Antarcticibacterium arcticum]
MKKIILLLILAITACKSPIKDPSAEANEETQQATVYYFIRHAEKDTTDPDEKDPELIPAGIQRAEKWAGVFKDISFDHIYSSNYKRTRATAQKIADSQQKDVEIYDASKLNDEEFQKKTEGKTVLVVGHSNTNPQFVNFILEEDKYEDIPDAENGSLFIVSVLPNGKKYSQVLYIN